MVYLDGKRRYDENSEKNIPFETKRDIHEKKRKYLKEKKDKKKQKKLDVGTKNDETKHNRNNEKKPNDRTDPFATPISVRCHSTATPSGATPIKENTSNPVFNFEASGINVYSYAESRAYEILNLKQALADANAGPNKQVFQKLPRHMRRRAASHDVRRLPKRLRNKAMNENVETKKAPSRKYKRKPRNLMEEYNRRSRLNAWLETHMWHAKRFKMIDKWGYRVPQKPCDKSFRALYRASAKSCVLQDQSYTEFIEISGSKKGIIQGLRRLTNSNAIGGLHIDDKKCLSGDCYGEEVIYMHDGYPHNVIGSVKFLWTTNQLLTSETKCDVECDTLIVLCHPSVSMQLLDELYVVFNVTKTEDSIRNDPPLEDETNSETANQSNGSTKNDPLLKEEMDVETNKESKDSSIDIKHHKLDFNYFSLTGPLSLQILQRALSLKKSYNINEGSVWNDPCAVHNFVVEDPRFHIPSQKKNPFTAQDYDNFSVDDPPSLSLWNESDRIEVKKRKLRDEEINEMRSKQLIPGSKLPVKSVDIPIVILQRPGKNFSSNKQDSPLDMESEPDMEFEPMMEFEPGGTDSPSYGDGYDLIVPGGWGMPFWMALVYQGARAGGVESNENIAFEATSFHFPTLYPDSKVHQEEATKYHDEKLQKHYRYPPDKRMNYDKLGFKHPFLTPWSHVVEEWKHIIKKLTPELDLIQNITFSKPDHGMYVLRERTLLMQLKAALHGHTDSKEVLSELLKHPNSLITVSVSSTREGTPFEKATLCIPNEEDIALSQVSRSERDNRLSEPQHKGSKRLFPYICRKHDILLPNATIVGRNTRWILGFVQKGGYSFTKGHGHGVGFISTVAFAYFLYLRRGSQMLFRNTNTLEYSFCNVDVLM